MKNFGPRDQMGNVSSKTDRTEPAIIYSIFFFFLIFYFYFFSFFLSFFFLDFFFLSGRENSLRSALA